MLADLDIQKLTWGLPSDTAPVVTPYNPTPDAATSPAEPEIYGEISNAAKAAAYMQQVPLKLRGWRQLVEKGSGDTPPDAQPFPTMNVDDRSRH